MFMRKTDADIKISIHALAKRATSPQINADPCNVISIHALAKRATTAISTIKSRLYISIHALAKRATKKAGIALAREKFQSTPSQRGRPAC